MGLWDQRGALAAEALNDALLVGGTPIAVSSGNVANAPGVATIPAVAGKIAHLLGFRISGLGAVAANAVAPTVAGVSTVPLPYSYVAVAGVLLPNETLVEQYPIPLPAPDDETDIVITCPALGAGNTRNAVIAFGVYRDAPA